MLDQLTLSDVFMLIIGFCLGNAFQCAIRGPAQPRDDSESYEHREGDDL
jgi:hypothetical protein